MFPTINKKETGVNLRRIMDMRGVKPKDIQEYLGFGCVQSVYRWMPPYILYECGKERNICRNIEIFNGTYRYKCYLKCVYTP